MKIVYLIIASDNPEHKRDEEIQTQTWANTEEVDAIWLRGGETTSYDSERRTLTVKVAEKYENILEKTLLGMNWCLDQHEFDFLVRGNVSTYFHSARIQKELLKVLANEKFLAGYIDFTKKGNQCSLSSIFVNGGAIFLNKRAVVELTKMPVGNWRNAPDDFAITQYLISKGFYPSRIARGNVSNTGFLTRKPYYRMKSSRNPMMASIRMQNLHSLITANTMQRKLEAYWLFEKTELMFFKRNFLNIREYLLSLYSIISSNLKWNLLRYLR